jgi:hypothetical protein
MGLFNYAPHPRTSGPGVRPPRTVGEMHGLGFNGRLAKLITEGVGTMWCAYAFAALALVAFPQAIKGGALTSIQWVSQTFLQLVLLSVIMVGQQVIGRASDERAINTYNDAEAMLHEIRQLHEHLAAQDAVIEALARRLEVPVPGGPPALAEPPGSDEPRG